MTHGHRLPMIRGKDMGTRDNSSPLVSIPLAEYQLLAKNYKRAVAEDTALELGDVQIALGRDIQQWLIRGMEHILDVALYTPSSTTLEMQAFLAVLRSAKLVMLIVHKPISGPSQEGVSGS